MRSAPDGTPLPKGIIFDPKKKRFRVRLYLKQRPIWVTYHYVLEEALEALKRAKDHRSQVAQHDRTVKSTSLEQIRAMRDKQINRRRP